MASSFDIDVAARVDALARRRRCATVSDPLDRVGGFQLLARNTRSGSRLPRGGRGRFTRCWTLNGRKDHGWNRGYLHAEPPLGADKRVVIE